MENKKGYSEIIKSKVLYNPFEEGEYVKAGPTTRAQKEMWTSIVMDAKASLCYNEAFEIKLTGQLDLEAFKKSFEDIIKENDALRMSFSSDGKSFFVKKFSESLLDYYDLTRKDDVDLELIKKSQVESLYDLVTGPCYRATLLKISHHEHLFLFSAHHIICDGWSLAVILKELSENYNNYLVGKKSPERNALQFSDYAIAENKNSYNKKDAQYWLQKFSQPLNENDFPVEFKRPNFRTFNSKRYDFKIPVETVIQLKKVGAKNGCSFYTTLMTALNIFLANLTKSQDIVVGMASATQSNIGEELLVGHLVNLLPLRISITENYPLKTFFKLVRSEMFDAFDHQSYGYGNLTKDLHNIKRDSSKMPLLNIVFNIDQQAPNQGLFLNDIKAELAYVPRVYENFELFINASSCGDNLVLECQYNTNLFSQSLIENWLSNYLELLNLIIKNQEMNILDYELSFLKIPKLSTTEEVVVKSLKNVKRDLVLESNVSKIWQRELGVEDILPDDNFFYLGGHSILAIEIAAKMENTFNKKVTIKDIFEHPTIFEISQYLVEDEEVAKDMLPKVAETGFDQYDVSFGQMQTWYLEELNPGTRMHNLPAAIRIKKNLDFEALNEAFYLIIEKQEALRTAIEVEAGIPIQKVKNSGLGYLKIEVENISENEIDEKLEEESRHLFDLRKNPLIKVKLFKISNHDYILFFVVHHAIWDGWSFDIFFRDLDRVYSSLVQRTPLDYKKPEVTYIDYTHWLNKLIKENKLKNEEEYWLKKLSGHLPVLDLPTDYKRSLEINNEASTFNFKLPHEIVTKLRYYAKLNNSSVFNVLLTAYKITLARYTNLDDIIVGMPVRGRTKSELTNTIGYFVNTVALRSSIFLNQSFEKNLEIVSKNCSEAFDNQLYPFGLLLNSLNLIKDSSRSAVFQTFLTYQDVSNREAQLDGSKYEQVNIPSQHTHTDLDIWFKSSHNKIEGAIVYRKDLFKEETIIRFFETLTYLLDNLVENDNTPLNVQRSISESTEKTILEDWNNTWSDTSTLVPFYKMIEDMCGLYPERLAIETTEKSITYKELNELSNQCANALRESGVTQGDLVGISLKRNLDLVPMILGILKAQAGYVPLDPSFPQERLDYMIESSKPKVLLTETSLSERFKGNYPKILISDILKNNLKEFDHYKYTNDLTDTAYVIYTSGSTGNPKGVQLTHGSVSNFLLSMKDHIGFGKEDKILAVTTLSFDIAVLELYLPLISGGSLFLASSSEAMDGGSLRQILDEKEITLMQATPSTWRLLLANHWRGNKELKVLCGGEAFPIDLARKLIPMAKEVWNMYGPTETTVWSSCKKLSLEDEFLTVGRPIANTSFYILDDNRNMLPIGASGELFIGGFGLAKGYYGRDDLTSERFIVDPFMVGNKMYATGDLARFKCDGEIECLGRNDGQVKIRGYRIELGEIEAEIQKMYNVDECTVITGEYRPGDMRIFAYYSTNDHSKITDKDFKENLVKKLPLYMLPSHFVYLEEIPKTLNGKIDKKSLPKIQAVETRDQKTEIVEIKNNQNVDAMEKIRLLWQSLIGVEEVKDTDNFFEIGGNSLIAVSLFSKISQEFNVNLPLATLISSKSFREFSDIVLGRMPKSNQGNSSNSLFNFNQLPTVFKSLICLNNQGSQNPIFCFHGVGGNVLNYIPLVNSTESKRPFMALQSVGLDGVTKPLNSIEAMAKFYINEMKLIQPHGPYLLAGGSMGGLIAFEVATQLEAKGEKVEKLIMFDTFGPNFDLKKYSSVEKVSRARSMWESLSYRLSYGLNTIQLKTMNLLRLNIPLVVLLKEIERSNYQAIWKYYPNRRLHADLHLIRAKITEGSWYSDPHLGWDGIVNGKINIYEIEGKHDSFIENPELIKVLKKLI